MNPFQKRIWPWMALGVTSLLSCNDSKFKFYLINKLRTPVAQIWIQGTDEKKPGCENFEGVGVLCQQFPLRPTSKMFLSFIVLSPEGSSAPTIKLDSLKSIGSSLSSSLSSGTSATGLETDVPLSQFGLENTPFAPLTKNIQTGPIRIDRVTFALETPSADIILNQAAAGGFPNFVLRYTSTSDAFSDNGLLSLQVFPEPQDPIWESISNLALSRGIPQEFIEKWRRDAITNTPPKLERVDPAEVVALGKDTDIEVYHTTQDQDPNAKKRVQWFFTQGEILNEHSSKTKFKAKEGGMVGGFVMVRDLQGGVDFKAFKWTAQ
jgi:hypothetical protein